LVDRVARRVGAFFFSGWRFRGCLGQCVHVRGEAGFPSALRWSLKVWNLIGRFSQLDGRPSMLSECIFWGQDKCFIETISRDHPLTNMVELWFS
jgi:hypothetical protein